MSQIETTTKISTPGRRGIMRWTRTSLFVCLGALVSVACAPEAPSDNNTYIPPDDNTGGTNNNGNDYPDNNNNNNNNNNNTNNNGGGGGGDDTNGGGGGGDTTSCSNLLKNAGFDDSTASPWLTNPGNEYSLFDTSSGPNIPAHSPSKRLWLGGYPNANDEISQIVTVPSSAGTIDVSGYVCVRTEETSSLALDRLMLSFVDESGKTLETLTTSLDNRMGNSAESCTWTKFDATTKQTYGGKKVTFKLRGTGNSTLRTSFYVDTLSLNACP